VWGRSASPEGIAVLHQTTGEGLVGGYDFRCAKERLFTTEDAHLEAGVGGQPRSVVCQRKIIADGGTQKFE